MPLIQKLTGKAYRTILRNIYKLGIDYDFNNDPQGVKTKRVRKNTVRVLTDKNSEGSTYIERYLTANAYQIYVRDIPEAIQEIDGGKGILSTNVTVNPETKQPYLDITDLALTPSGPVVKKFTKSEIQDRLQPRTVYMKKNKEFV
jgi:hypothetical protein